MTQKTFTRDADNLGQVYQFAEDLMTADNIGDDVKFPIHLALEELFINLVKYNTDGTHDIEVEIDTSDGAVSVSLTDRDVEGYDVTRARDVDIKATLKERRPGGLGLHLVQQMVDTLEYDYRDRRSRIRFTKKPGNRDV